MTLEEIIAAISTQAKVDNIKHTSVRYLQVQFYMVQGMKVAGVQVPEIVEICIVAGRPLATLLMEEVPAK